MTLESALLLGLVVYFAVLALYYALAGCPREFHLDV